MLTSWHKMTRYVQVGAPNPEAVYGNRGTTPRDRERYRAAIVDDQNNMLTLRRCLDRVKT